MGLSWGYLGAMLGPFGTPKTAGRFRGTEEAPSRAEVGLSWGYLGAMLRPFGTPKTAGRFRGQNCISCIADDKIWALNAHEFNGASRPKHCKT